MNSSTFHGPETSLHRRKFIPEDGMHDLNERVVEPESDDPFSLCNAETNYFLSEYNIMSHVSQQRLY
jgi:hypothetical protein